MPRRTRNLKTSSSPAEGSSKLPPELKKILRFVWQSRFSDFYREKFAKAGLGLQDIKTWEDFKRLPFTTKEEIIARDPDELLFLPLQEVSFVRYSSGTSGRGLSVVYKSPTELERFYKKVAPRFERILILASPRAVPQEYSRYRSLGKLVVVGEPQNLEASAVLAAKTKIDAISASPSLLLNFLPYLKKHYDPAGIKFLRLGTEGVTPLGRKLLKNQFPAALLFSVYSSTEATNIAYQCPVLAADDNAFNIYHPVPWYLFETVGGELVLTALEKMPFPLVRYRTGDRGELFQRSCRCGQKLALRVYGRLGSDVLRVEGVEFRRGQIEKIFSSLEEWIKKGSVHVYEELADDKIIPRIVLWVVTQKELSSLEKEKILTLFSEKLFVSQHQTLGDLVRKGVFKKPLLEIQKAEAPENNLNFEVLRDERCSL